MRLFTASFAFFLLYLLDLPGKHRTFPPSKKAISLLLSYFIISLIQINVIRSKLSLILYIYYTLHRGVTTSETRRSNTALCLYSESLQTKSISISNMPASASTGRSYLPQNGSLHPQVYSLDDRNTTNVLQHVYRSQLFALGASCQ